MVEPPSLILDFLLWDVTTLTSVVSSRCKVRRTECVATAGSCTRVQYDGGLAAVKPCTRIVRASRADALTRRCETRLFELFLEHVRTVA